MWQEIAIIIIGITMVLFIGWKVYNMLKPHPKAFNACGGCKGCALKK